MKTPDFGLLPFIESCLVVQSFFLNFLWIFLGWAWLASAKMFPRDTLRGGIPGQFQFAIALLAWGITFGVSLYEFEPVYWFLGFAIANGAFLSILNPACALCFSTSMLLLRPWEIMPENALILYVPRFSMFFTFGWAIFYLFVVDRFSLRVNRAVVLLLAFAAWMFLSTFVTPSPADAQASFSETIVRAVTIFLLIYHLARDRFSVWALKTTLVVMFTCVGLISVIFYLDGYTDGGRIIAFGVFKNTNDIAAVMTILLPLALAPYFREGTGLTEKLLALFPVLTALAVLAFAQSRGAIMSMAACGAVYALLRIKRKSLAVAAILGILVVGQAATMAFSRGAGDLEGSSASRKSFWISGMRMALYNPAFGVGYGQFPSNFETYALEIVGEYGKRSAHSAWILALAEGGAIGLVLFAGLYIVGGVLGGLRVAREDPSLLYAITAYGTSITFLSHTYMMFPFLLVGIATAAASAARAPQGNRHPIPEARLAA